MARSEVFNVDCLEYMKSLPDNAFDLCIADPPYGGGFTEGGGCKGWFTKYNMKAPESDYNKNKQEQEHRNLRGRFDRYNDAEACSQIHNAKKKENKDRSITGSEAQAADLNAISVHRTGGASSKWKTNAIYGKKLSRGTLPQDQNTSRKCSASHAIRLFGAAIISSFHRPAAS